MANPLQAALSPQIAPVLSPRTRDLGSTSPACTSEGASVAENVSDAATGSPTPVSPVASANTSSVPAVGAGVSPRGSPNAAVQQPAPAASNASATKAPIAVRMQEVLRVPISRISGSPRTNSDDSAGSTTEKAVGPSKQRAGAQQSLSAASSAAASATSPANSPKAASSSGVPDDSKPASEFSITLENPVKGGQLGFSVDPAMVVSQLEAEGLCAIWNAANPDKAVRVGHRILQVNGKIDSADMSTELKTANLLEIKLLREAPEITPRSTTSSVRSRIKAWVSGATTSSNDGLHAGHAMDSFDVNDAETKDEDVVELPGMHASSQASFLTQGQDEQAGRNESRTSKLSPGDLVALRELAVEAAGEPESKENAGSLITPAIGPYGLSGPVAPPAANAAAAEPGTQPPVSRTQQWPSQPTPMKVPSEDDADPVTDMHSSNSSLAPAMVPSLLFRSYQGVDPNSQCIQQQRATNSQAPKEETGPLRDPLRTHGGGSSLAAAGFLEAGPFWTCGSTPHCRGSAGRAGKTNSSSSNTMISQVFRNSSAVASPAGGSCGLDLSAHISSILGNCINILSEAIEVRTDPEPPEDELTTVLLETKEQRLQWRDFLSEAVSKCKANALFQSYDVEADPPRYARPPLSSAPKADAALLSYRLAGGTPPHIVAPRGAGWSPIPSNTDLPITGSAGAASSSSSHTWQFGSQPRFGPAIPTLGGDNDIPASIAPTPSCTPAPMRPGEDTGAATGFDPLPSSKSDGPARSESLQSVEQASLQPALGSKESTLSRCSEGVQQPATAGKVSAEDRLSPSSSSRPGGASAFTFAHQPESKSAPATVGRRPAPAG